MAGACSRGIRRDQFCAVSRSSKSKLCGLCKGGTQFACFTSTKAQILTLRACAASQKREALRQQEDLAKEQTLRAKGKGINTALPIARRYPMMHDSPVGSRVAVLLTRGGAMLDASGGEVEADTESMTVSASLSLVTASLSFSKRACLDMYLNRRSSSVHLRCWYRCCLWVKCRSPK